MKEGTENVMKKRSYWAGIAALALSLLLTGCGMELSDPADGVDNAPGLCTEDSGPALDAVVGTDGLDTAGDEEDGTADTLPAAPEEDPGTSGEGGLLYEDLLPSLDEDGTYNSAGDVSLYLYTYGHLPENYITKREARDLGWSGGSVEKYAPGHAIGGDKFGNREGVLPDGTYHECDIDTIGQDSRGAKRLVYADDGRIYYTEDHYETFTLLYGEEERWRPSSLTAVRCPAARRPTSIWQSACPSPATTGGTWTPCTTCSPSGKAPPVCWCAAGRLCWTGWGNTAAHCAGPWRMPDRPIRGWRSYFRRTDIYQNGIFKIYHSGIIMSRVILVRLKELRKARRITQLKLAMDLNLTQNTVSRYETGEREPGIAELVRIADYFHISVDYLLERTDNPEMNL